MEFAAPIYNNTPFVITLSVMVAIVVGSIILALLKAPKTDKLAASFVILIFGALFTVVGAGIAASTSDDNYNEDYRQVITQTDSRVYLSQDSSISRKQEYVLDQNLLVKDTNQVLSCTSVLVADTYTIACEDPGSNGKMVSVDEALRNA